MFFAPPVYILDRYKKISNIHLRHDILKEINNKFTPADNVTLLFMHPKYPDSLSRKHPKLQMKFCPTHIS